MLMTFSGETGHLMVQLESHDITFAFGPFLIYLLLNWKHAPRSLFWLVLTALFFLIGLKRIAVPAVALGFAAAFSCICCRRRRPGRRHWAPPQP